MRGNLIIQEDTYFLVWLKLTDNLHRIAEMDEVCKHIFQDILSYYNNITRVPYCYLNKNNYNMITFIFKFYPRLKISMLYLYYISSLIGANFFQLWKRTSCKQYFYTSSKIKIPVQISGEFKPIQTIYDMSEEGVCAI